MAPPAADGVPTHTSDTSAMCRASAHEVVACSEPPATACAMSAVQARLGDRAAARAHLVDLGRVDVDAPDIVALRGQAGRRHRPDVAETEHRYLHHFP